MKIDYDIGHIYLDTTGRKGWDGIQVIVYKKTEDNLLRFDITNLVNHINGNEPFSNIRHYGCFPQTLKEFIDEYYKSQYAIDKQSYIDNVKQFVEERINIEEEINDLYELQDYIKLPNFLFLNNETV